MRIFRAIADEIAPRFKVKQIGYDPWNALQFALQLEQAGFEPVEVRQGPRTLSAPCKALHALTKAGRVHDDGNQAMAWCVANAAVKEDENPGPVKTNPRKRIDGVVAAVARGSWCGPTARRRRMRTGVCGLWGSG